MTSTTFQNMLKNELSERKSKNSKYSLRAFARDLNLTSGFLTLLLKEKKALSAERAMHVAQRLRWPEAKKVKFQNLVRWQKARDPVLKKQIEAEYRSVNSESIRISKLERDTFRIIADWYHYAILELSETKNSAIEDVGWVAKRLNITESQVNQALIRLKRLGLLVEKGKSLVKSTKNYSFGDIPEAALRLHHKQFLNKAVMALKTQDFAERDFSSVTLSFDCNDLEKAKEKIKKFRRDFMSEFSTENPDSVYQISIQFFRLDEESKI